MKVITLVAVLALLFSANCWTASPVHEINGAASHCIWQGINYTLYIRFYSGGRTKPLSPLPTPLPQVNFSTIWPILKIKP